MAASSFLQDLANERAKKVEAKYGEGSYGSSSWQEQQAKTISSPSSVGTKKTSTSSLSSKKKKKKKEAEYTPSIKKYNEDVETVRQYNKDYGAKNSFLGETGRSITDSLNGKKAQAEEKKNKAVESLKEQGLSDKQIKGAAAKKYTQDAVRRKVGVESNADLLTDKERTDAISSYASDVAEKERLRQINLEEQDKKIAELEKKVKAEKVSKGNPNINHRGSLSAHGEKHGERTHTGTAPQMTEAELELAQLRADRNKAASLQYDDKVRSDVSSWDDKVKNLLKVYAQTATKDEIKAAGITNMGETQNAALVRQQAARTALENMGYDGTRLAEMAKNLKWVEEQDAYDAKYEKWAEKADYNPGLASIESVGTNIAGGLIGMADLTMQKLEKDINGDETPLNMKSKGMQGYAATQGVRMTVSENLANMHDAEFMGQNVASFLYNTGMSMADSGAIIALSMAGIPPTFGTAMLGCSAAVDSTVNAKARGLTDTQALLTGYAAGVAECVFEEVSLDHFLKTTAPRGTVMQQVLGTMKNIGTQGLVEASEEVSTSIANAITDAIINGDLSEYNTSVRNYQAQGYTLTDAQSMARKDFVVQLATDAAGGFLSGGVFGMFGGDIDSRMQSSKWSTTAKNIMIGMTQAEDSAVYQAAEKANALYNGIIDKLDSGAKVSEEERASAEQVFDELGAAVKSMDKAELRKAKVQVRAIQRASKANAKQAEKATQQVSGMMKNGEAVELEQTEEAKPAKPAYATELLTQVIENPGATGNVTDKQAGAIIADRASVEALGLEYGGEKTLANMTATQSRAAVRKAVQEHKAQVEAETAAETTEAPAAEQTAKTEAAPEQEGFTSYEQFSKEFREDEHFKDYSEEEMQRMYQLTKEWNKRRESKVFLSDIGRVVSLSEFRQFAKQAEKQDGTDYTEEEILGAFDAAVESTKADVERHEADRKANLDTMAQNIKSAFEARKLGIDVEVVYGENEYFQAKGTRENAVVVGNKIVFNGNVINSGEAMLYVLGHELVHPGARVDEKLVDTIIETFQYLADNGIIKGKLAKRVKNIEDTIESTRELYQQHENELAAKENREAVEQTTSKVREEVAADLMREAFASTEICKEIVGYNPGLANKVKDAIRRVKNAITGADGKLNPEAQQKLDELNKQFDDALKLVAEKNSRFNDDNVEGKVDSGAEPGVPNPSQPQFSLSTWEQPNYKSQFSGAGFSRSLAKDGDSYVFKTGHDVLSALLDKEGVDSDVADRVLTWMDGMADFMRNAGVKYQFINLAEVNSAKVSVRYDTDGKPLSIALSAMVKNGEYPVNFDLTQICKRREAMSKFVNKLLAEHNFDEFSLSKANLLEMMKILSAEGYDTACTGCFVESKRYYMEDFTKRFIKKWNDAVKKINPNADYFNFADANREISPQEIEDADEAMEAFRSANAEISAQKTANIEETLARISESGISTEDIELIRDSNKRGHEAVDADREAGKEAKFDSQKYVSDKKLAEFAEPRAITANELKYLVKHDVFGGKKANNAEQIENLVKSDPVFQRLLTPADIMTTSGLTQFTQLSDTLVSLLSGSYGSGAPKLAQGFIPYNNEIAFLPDKVGKINLSEYLQGIAGLRSQSFSDFKIENVFDYFQMAAELTARHLPAHMYTKELACAKILGMLGVKVNMSVMFNIEGDSYWGSEEEARKYAGLIRDKEGNITYNYADKANSDRVFEETGKRPFIQSIDVTGAFELQDDPRYSKNIGVIGVGYGDEHIRMMLNDPRFRYIIPYHRSSLPVEISNGTNLNRATDYTSTQNTMSFKVKDSSGKEVSMRGKSFKSSAEFLSWVEENGYTLETKKAQAGHGEFDLYGDLEKTNDPKQTAENYKAWCWEHGYLPLFYQFSSEENYYKLLYDFSVTDHKGNYAPQEAVHMWNEDGKMSGFPDDIMDVVETEMKAQNSVNEELWNPEKVEHVVDTIYNTVKLDKSSTQNFTSETTGESVSWSISEKEPNPLRNPDGSIKYVYKAFYARDGKLYPPMVSNQSETENKVRKAVSGTLKGNETPVGVWLDADIGEIATDENGSPLRNKRGRLAVRNAKSGGGATLAFRPGWHLGEWPDAKQFNKGPVGADGSRHLMPDELVFAKCEISGDIDYQLDAMALGVKDNGKYDRTQAGLPRVPVDGYYKYRTNPNPKTVPWYIAGSIRVVEILDDDDTAKICAEYGVKPDPRVSGKKIDLSEYGLTRGPVSPTTDLERFTKNQKNIENERLLQAALDDPAYADAYKTGEINFDDPEIIKEFERNGQDVAAYRQKAEQSRFSLSEADTEYMELAKNPEANRDRLQQMVDEAAKKAGYTIRGNHGTTNLFYTFNTEESNIENDWGKGIYATNSEKDAEVNYASADGADLTNRIERLAEMMQDWDEYADMDYDQCIDAARRQLSQGESKILHLAYKMDNPVVVERGNGGTFFEFEESYDDEMDEYSDPSGKLVDVIAEMKNIIEEEYEWADADALNSIYDEAIDYGGLSAAELHLFVSDVLVDTTDDLGNIASNEILRKALENVGYDGIVDNSVAYKFGELSGKRYGGMVGVTKDTSHFIAFNSAQVKLTDPVTYDDNGNVIPLSKRFNSENNDIRYSVSNLDEENNLDIPRNKKYNRHTRYSETETLFLRWANGSAPVGEVKQFTRFKKHHFYEKTENGCVEITAGQYAERRGIHSDEDYRRAYREIDEAAHLNETGSSRDIRDSGSHGDDGNAELLSQHIVGEELRHDTEGGLRGIGGNGANLSDGKINSEAPDEGASSASKGSFSLSSVDSEGNMLSEGQLEFFKDSKVRDADGNLMKVYHGTANGGNFTVFDATKLNNSKLSSHIGQGFYFTNDAKAAKEYMSNFDIYGHRSKGKNPNMFQGYLNITNPIEITENSHNLSVGTIRDIVSSGNNSWFFESGLAHDLQNKEINGVRYTKADISGMSLPQKLNLYANYLYQYGDMFALQGMVDAYKFNNQATLLKAMQVYTGNDGIMWNMREGLTQYVAFNSNQFKNADNLNPTNDPDIRYSLSPADGMVEYNSTALWKESTIDKYLHDYAAKMSPNYAQAYVAWMSPKQFLDLTTSISGRHRVVQESHNLDVDEFTDASLYQPIQLAIDSETGDVVGHEGRHRMVALSNAGIYKVPVLLFDSSNKYSKTHMDEMILGGQDFGSSRSLAVHGLTDVMPFNYANRDAIIEKFSTKTSLMEMGEKYAGKTTLQYSVEDDELKSFLDAYDEAFGEGASKADFTNLNQQLRAARRARRTAEMSEESKQAKISLSNRGRLATERAWEIYHKRTVRTVRNEYRAKLEQSRKDKIAAVKQAVVVERAKAEVKLEEQELAERMNAKKQAAKRLGLKDEQIQQMKNKSKEKSQLQRNASRSTLKNKRLADKKRAAIETEQGPISTIRENPQQRTFTEKLQSSAENLRTKGRSLYKNFVNKAMHIDRVAKRQTSHMNASVLASIVSSCNSTVSDVYTKGLTDRQGNMVGKSMKEVFLCLDEKGNIDYDKQALFQDYALHLHNVDRMSFVAKARAKLEAFEAANSWLAEMDKNEFARLTAMTETELEKSGKQQAHDLAVQYSQLLQEYSEATDKPVFPDKNGNPITAETSRQVVAKYEAENPWLKEKAQEMYDWWDQFMRIWVVGDSITQEQYDTMRETYPHYVPTYRVDGKGLSGAVSIGAKGAKPGQVVKSAKGGLGEIVNIEDSFANLAAKAVKSARVNELYKNLVDTAMLDDNGVFEDYMLFDWDSVEQGSSYATQTGEVVSVYGNGFDVGESVDAAEAPGLVKTKDGYKVSAWYNGRLLSTYVSEDLFTSLQETTGAVKDKLDKVAKVGSVLTNPMKTAITGINPNFALRNTMRDFPTAVINSVSGLAFPKYWARAWKEIYRSDAWHNFVALGGTNSLYYNTEGGFGKAMSVERGAAGTVKKVWNGTKDVMGFLNETTESVTRFAEYLATVDRMGDTYENRLIGIKNAAEVTVDFSRKGSYGAAINAWVPYWNPAVQGIDKVFRSVFEAPNGKKAFAHGMATLGRAVMTTVLLEAIQQVILAALGRRDDWEELNDRTKDTYYCIPTKDHKFIKIPKNREWGAILGTPLMRLFEGFTGRDDPYENFLETSIIPNFLPGGPTDLIGLSQYIDIATNKDFAGRSIVPYAYTQGSLAGQYDDKTSEMAKLFSKLLGEKLGPMQVDYIIQDYFGDFGDIATMLTAKSTWGEDESVKGILESLWKTVESPWVADNRYSNADVSVYYENIDELERIYNDKKNHGDGESYQDSIEYKTFQAVVYKSYGKEISEINKQIKDLPDGEKKDELKGQIAKLAGQANEFIDKCLSGDIEAPDLVIEYENLPVQVSDELIRLRNLSKEYSFKPSPSSSKSYVDPTSKVGNKAATREYVLDDEAKAQYNSIYEDTYSKTMQATINSYEYRKANDTHKAEMLEDARDTVAPAVKEEFMLWLQRNRKPTQRKK